MSSRPTAFAPASVLPLVLLLLVGLAGCAARREASRSLEAPEPDTGLPEVRLPRALSAETIERHVARLASDEFGGRAPASPGEELTVRYLADELERLGVRPGNDDSYFQTVPLLEIEAGPRATLRVSGAGGTEAFHQGEELVAWTKRPLERSGLLDSELVFVGYGVVAPEQGWDDYGGVDVRGKTVVALVNDPGFFSGDETLFRGRRMTYYGRWTYKIEEAARQGAEGILLLHDTLSAGYPWEVVLGSWTGPQFDLESGAASRGRAAVEGWLRDDAAQRLFRLAGRSLETERRRAQERGFRATPLDLRATISLENRIARSRSRNVIGIVPGSTRPDELVLYTAHWDHLGTDEELEGDGIYNGAVDNASGTAGLLALADAFATLEPRPERSVAFLFVTAEEKGLLGSRYYATHPLHPLRKTVALINIDGLNVHGPTRDMVLIGGESSDLADDLRAAAARQGRVVADEPEPEKGFFFRSDQFSFAREGVPVLYAKSGWDSVEHGPAWGKARSDEYTAERYHKPADELDASWDLRGALLDLEVMFEVGRSLAASSRFPEWAPDSEFRAAREL